MRAFLPFATLATAALCLGCQEQQWKIAFESQRDEDPGIYVVNPDGSDLQNLTPGGGGGSLPGPRTEVRSFSRPIYPTAAVRLARRFMSWMRTDRIYVA